MAAHGSIARLIDIVEAIELVRQETAAITLTDFALDWRKQWIVERGLEIISEASRRLPPEIKSRHLDIPWSQVAGIGNVLRHDYERIAYDIIWRVVQDDLLNLELACRRELETAADDASGRSADNET